VTEENIRDTQSARNIRVLKVLRRFALAEDSGRGVDVIQDRMAEALLVLPSSKILSTRFASHSRSEVLLALRSERGFLTLKNAVD
jgi:predicted HTH transcriptional regulator